MVLPAAGEERELSYFLSVSHRSPSDSIHLHLQEMPRHSMTSGLKLTKCFGMSGCISQTHGIGRRLPVCVFS